MPKKRNRELQVKISDETLRGCYANNLVVTHTTEEFVLDFVLSLPPQGIINSRVIISPRHLKRIINALQKNLVKYEEKNGTVTGAPAPAGPKAGSFH